jgi:hypothetical protein
LRRRRSRFSNSLSSRRRTTFGRFWSELNSSFEADIQKSIYHLVSAHADAVVVVDRDPSGILVEIYGDLLCVGVPRIRDDFR